MSADGMMLIFDVIVLIYGIYGIYSAFQMRKTGVPSKILVSQEEIYKIRNAKEFCERMFKPTLIFGVMACAYSLVEALNQYVIRRGFVDILCAVCIVAGCVWYCRELRRVRAEHI